MTTLARSFARQAGKLPALVSTTGTTDAAVFGNVGGIPAVCFGPYAEAAHGIRGTGVPCVRDPDSAGHGLVHQGLVRAIRVAIWLCAPGIARGMR